MNRVFAFSQRELINRLPDDISLPTRGMCFRLTFKWAGCTVYGGTFQYGNANPGKTATKHAQYRGETLALEKQYGDDLINHMEEYTLTDWNESRKFVSQWAQSFTDANKNKLSAKVVDQSEDSIREYLQQHANLGTVAIMAGFYGRRQGKIFGHVVAYCSVGGPTANGPCFFDSNTGVYEFGPNEDQGSAMMAHIKRYAAAPNGAITDFNTIVLKPA